MTDKDKLLEGYALHSYSLDEAGTFPGIDETSFKITLNENWFEPKDLLPMEQYVIGCDPHEVEEPLNFWHKILAKMNMKYKKKLVGWAHTVYKLSEIEGKIIAENINKKQ